MSSHASLLLSSLPPSGHAVLLGCSVADLEERGVTVTYVCDDPLTDCRCYALGIPQGSNIHDVSTVFGQAYAVTLPSGARLVARPRKGDSAGPWLVDLAHDALRTRWERELLLIATLLEEDARTSGSVRAERAAGEVRRQALLGVHDRELFLAVLIDVSPNQGFLDIAVRRAEGRALAKGTG